MSDIEIPEDIAAAVSDLVRAAESVGEAGYRPGRPRAERERDEARAELDAYLRQYLARGHDAATRNVAAMKLIAETYCHPDGEPRADMPAFVNRLANALLGIPHTP